MVSIVIIMVIRVIITVSIIISLVTTIEGLTPCLGQLHWAPSDLVAARVLVLGEVLFRGLGFIGV